MLRLHRISWSSLSVGLLLPTMAVAADPPTAPPPAQIAPEGTTTTTIVTTTTSTTPTTTTPTAPPMAPVDPYVHVPINIGVFPPLSINGAHRDQKIRNTLSAAFGWSRVHRLEGAAAALGATIIDEDARGVTWSLGANLTHGEHLGVQSSQGFNHAGSLRGVQLGMVNHVHEARGIQAGLINVGRGRVRGIQVGLINYAEEADLSFALIPVTKKGGVRPEVWTSDTAAINVGIRLPANYTYAFFAGAMHPFARRQPPVTIQDTKGPGTSLMAGMGYGGHIPVTDEVAIDGDLSGWVVTAGLRTPTAVAGLAKARAMVSWQIRPRLALWGGPTFNLMVDQVGVEARAVPRPGYGFSARAYAGVRWWPGFAAGLRF